MSARGGAYGLSTRARREPLPDALRALAMIGVLLVNAMGYQDAPYGRLLGAPHPPDSVVADALTALVAAAAQGKAYPMLAFLFGVGLAYAARGRPRADAVQGARRRAGRLLVLGILHGALVYFGDILTLYALCAYWTAWHVHEPWRRLLRRLRSALAWALAAVAASCALAVLAFGPVGPAATLGSVTGWGEFFIVNASTYVAAQTFGLLLSLPLVRLAMLAGVAAGRLRLLRHRRWHTLARVILRRVAVPLLLANAAYGVAYAALPGRESLASAALEAASPLWTTALAMVYVAFAVHLWHTRAQRWAAWLAPLGQHTLSVYVGSSLILLAAFSGVGWGWQPTTWQWVLGALAAWLAAALASRGMPGRWPLEIWMARR